jgi:hypothetical protein
MHGILGWARALARSAPNSHAMIAPPAIVRRAQVAAGARADFVEHFARW